MLSFALITYNAGPGLRRCLESLAQGMKPGEDLVALDLGSTDDTLPELAGFMGPREGELIRLTTPDLPRPEVLALTRRAARHPYLLVLEGNDVLRPEALDGLRRVLAQAPQVVVLNRGWTLAGGAAALPAPDDTRLAALGPDPTRAALMTLSPDPGRVLICAELADRLGGEVWTSGAPTMDWPLWQRVLSEAASVALYPETLWLSPLPDRPAAPAFAAIAAHPPPVEDIARTLTWAEDALLFAAPDDAPILLQAAQDMLVALSPEQVAAIPENGPVGAMLGALAREDTALALSHVVLGLAMQERRRNDALAAALAGLRHDLDLALPGPEYLRDLYDRIRAR